MHFEQNQLIPYWFPVKKPIWELEIRDSSLYLIRPNAFNANEFSTLIRLHLVNLPNIRILRNETFNGLNNLRFLSLQKINIHYVTPNILYPCPNIEYFRINNWSNDVQNFTSFTGFKKLKKLTNIRFNSNNFKNTIKENTFSGLVAVKYIFLDRNQIEVIGENSFDRVNSTLKLLSLTENRLKTIPYGLFDFLFEKERQTIRISLHHNEWNCSCQSEYLHNMLRKFPLTFNVVKPRCGSPINLHNQDIMSIKDLGCSRNSYCQTIFKFSNTSYKIKINHNTSNGKVQLIIEKPTDLVIIGLKNKKDVFNHKFDLKEAICYTIDEKKSKRATKVKIKKLKSDRFYQFCVMKRGLSTTSPLDCIFFHTLSIKTKVFVSNKYRPFALTCFIFVNIVVFSLGIYLSMIATKSYLKYLRFKKSEKRLKKFEDSVPMREMPSKKMYAFNIKFLF